MDKMGQGQEQIHYQETKGGGPMKICFMCEEDKENVTEYYLEDTRNPDMGEKYVGWICGDCR